MNDRQFDIFFEIHQDLPRQGPGSYDSTKRAIELLHLPTEPRILDVGCGPGKQTLDLLSLTNGYITAVDYYDVFVDSLRATARRLDIDRIRVDKADMNALPYEAESFDLIWSEGAIYIMGFEKGLKEWRSLLKPQGYLAVTEITWLRPDPPREVYDYWLEQYPAMKNIDDNVAFIRKSGYHHIGHFTLPHQDWWTDYYDHIEKRLPQFREKYRHDREALQVVDMEAAELEMHRRYSDYYGYVFYIMQK